MGVIPEEWKVSTVGCEFEIKLGKMIDAERNVGVPKPYLGNKAVQWSRIDIGNLPTVPMSRSDIERFRLRKGDLLVCEGGEIGRAAIWEAPIEECYYQKALHRLRSLRGFDSQLLVALLRQWSERGLLTNYVTQTSIAHLPRVKFLEVPVPVPPPAEQRAIVGALSDVDALIASLEQLIAKKRDLKQATMQQLLTGKTRLPGFGGQWDVKQLGEIANVKTGPFGSSLHESDYVQEGTPIITVEHLGELGVIHFNLPLVSDSDYQRLRAYSLQIGDIVFSRVGSVDRNALIRSDEEGWLFSGRLLRVRPDRRKAVAPFLSYQFHGERFKSLVRNVAVGQTMACLNTQILKSIAVVLPSLGEQTAIAAVLSDMDAEIAALEQRLAKTHDLEQGMMQELLTGKTRLV
ncbi:MAG: type I restriction enzyme, S subunit [Nitrospira sp. OLB3]|nr:MAG: type I restriction enzyme, S subunit [Nitrospira sp. OLB3]